MGKAYKCDICGELYTKSHERTEITICNSTKNRDEGFLVTVLIARTDMAPDYIDDEKYTDPLDVCCKCQLKAITFAIKQWKVKQ